MKQSTRAAVLAAPRRFNLVDRPAPVAAAGEAVVRISSTAVCHTDLSIFTGDHPGVKYPVVLGHESTGIVESIGDGATGGGNLKADDIRSLMAVRERESAEIALFISLETPTRGMIADAASAGFYESVSGKKFPRVQLLTIEGLLAGTHRAEHPDHQPDLNFKKAKAEANAAQRELM